MTKKHEVIRPWFGVEKGQIVTEVGAMFKANVREVTANLDGQGSDDLNECKAELKTARSNLTRAENALKAKDEAIAKLQESNKELENQLTESLGRIVELENKGADKK